MGSLDRTRHQRFAFADSDALLRAAAELDLAIPFSRDLTPLFKPIEAAGKTLPNRLAVHPMEGADAEADGGPGELTFRRYRRFGAGGCGLIGFEATAVAPEGRSSPRQLWLTEQNVGRFARLVNETHRAAGDRPIACILQLTHSGRFARPEGTPAPMIVRRHPALDAARPNGRMLSDEELDRLLDAFVQAACRAAEAGFDGVDIKACHGYLVSELLAAAERPGKYGGAFEGRSRFLRETVRRIREARPELLVASRISAFDGLDAAGRGEAGTDAAPRDAEEDALAEAAALCAVLAGEGASLLSISAGIPYLNPHVGRPFDRPLSGGSAPAEHPLAGVARLIRLTGSLQKRLPSVPVAATGYSWLRGLFPQVAAGVLKEGKASIIGLGRMAFACPDFALRLQEEGRVPKEKSCVACSGCSALLRASRPAGCVVRDREVYAQERA